MLNRNFLLYKSTFSIQSKIGNFYLLKKNFLYLYVHRLFSKYKYRNCEAIYLEKTSCMYVLFILLGSMNISVFPSRTFDQLHHTSFSAINSHKLHRYHCIYDSNLGILDHAEELDLQILGLIYMTL